VEGKKLKKKPEKKIEKKPKKNFFFLTIDQVFREAVKHRCVPPGYRCREVHHPA
jgi:hypothetical protein